MELCESKIMFVPSRGARSAERREFWPPRQARPHANDTSNVTPLSTPRPGKRGLCGGAGAGPGSDAPRPPLPAPAPPGPDFKHDRAAALPAGVEAAVSPVSELGSTPAAQEPGPSGQEKGQEGRAGGEPGERGGSEPPGTGEPPPEAVPAAGPGPGGAPAGGAGLERADTVPNAA